MSNKLTELSDAGLAALIEYLHSITNKSREIHSNNSQQLIDALKESIERANRQTS